MGCIQSSAPQSGTSLKHVQTQSGAAVYISNDEAAQYSATWQYLEDINTANWRAYNPNNSRQINVAYNTQATKCQISNQNGEAFELDFQRMTETNVVNGWQRKIRMQPTNAQNHNQGHNINLNTFSSSTKSISHNPPNLHSPHNKAQQPSITSYSVSPKHQNDINPLLVQPDLQNEHKKQHQHQHSSHRYKWQWFSESIGWKDYDDKLSAKIDEAYTENIARYAFKIRSNNTKYEIDFDHMKQSNLDTHKLRIIRRVKRDQVAAMNGYDGNVHVNEERFVWEFFNDLEGVWYEYGDNVSLKIETVHHSNAAVARMKIHGVEFEIRLNEMPMNQMSLKTGKISQIRRVVKSGHNKRVSTMKKNVIGASNEMLKPQSQIKKFQWRYKEMFNVWEVYPGQLNTKIENAFRAELERYSFQMNGHEFEIQFNFLRMVNLQTNATNEIARIDNLSKNRSPSMFNQPARNGHGNQNNYNHGVTHSMNVAGMGDNVQRKNEFGKKKKKHVARSYTVDMGSNHANSPGLDNNFNLLIKQQQKAMKYFNKQHEKKKSSMSLNLSKNEFNPDINIIHKNAQIEQKREELDDFVWKYKNDDGTWSSYSQQLNNQIENAHQGGQYTIEIEKNGIFYQIKFEHNLECHFATNKMRSIQRVQLNNGVPQIVIKKKVKSVEINQEFDALSNNLESVKHAKNMLSDYDEHDEEEKDEQFANNTPQIPVNNDNDSDESEESDSYSQEDSDESEEYEEEEESDAESEEEEDEEEESAEEQEFQGTPASQVALKDYGNDYNEYMQKFQNLKKV